MPWKPKLPSVRPSTCQALTTQWGALTANAASVQATAIPARTFLWRQFSNALTRRRLRLQQVKVSDSRADGQTAMVRPDIIAAALGFRRIISHESEENGFCGRVHLLQL